MDNKRHYTTLTKLFACTVLVGLLAIGSANAQTHVVVHGSVFGGGNEATVSGNTEVLMQDSATVKTDVYGGGAFASTGTENGNNTTIVTIEGGTVGDADYGTDGKGNVFGGALGDATHSPDVNGAITVNIGTSTQSSNNVVVKGNIFGCNNAAGTPKDSVRVHIYHTAHTPDNGVGTYTDMEDFTDFVKNDAAAHAPASFALQSVYGGGNKADYTPASGKGARVHIHNCDNTVKMVYGGGRAAAVGTNSVNANTSITVDGGRLDTLFAGGDGHTTSDGQPKNAGNTYLAADINGNVSAWVRCGYYSAVFGASNTSGTITGTKSVTIDYSGPCANVSNDEFIVSLFGGGNMADIEGDVELTIACGAGEIDEVYGGSNMASIDNGNVTLNLYGGKYHSVFGGSKGVVAGAAANIGGNVTLNLYGGDMVNAFGGSNQNGNITGTITVNVLDKEAANCVLRIDTLYGAGNVTAYTPDDTTIISPVVNLMHIKNNDGTEDLGVTGDVFGGGLGLTATVTANPQVNIGYDAATQSSLKPADYTDPSDFPLATVGNNVYGGGSLASVVGNTAVNIRNSNTVIWNTVYGAGKGDDHNPDAAIVKGNATVTMDDGNVRRSVYGGGELSSVGTFTYYPSTVANSSPTVTDGHVKGEPASAKAGTGITKIVIKGGVIGLLSNNRMPNPADPTIEDDYGYIFCAGKGIADSTIVDGEGVPYANRLAVVDSTYLEISGGLITASVYGGSENGEVLRNTHVKITGGQIGEGFNPKNTTWDGVYDEADWTTVINKVKDGTFTDADTAGFHFCDAWPFNAEGTRYTYDYFATHYNSTDKQYYYDAGFTKPSYNGSNRAGDGHSYFGHVFGGGSGYYPFAPGVWRRSAGRVKGDTYVEITGGHILTNIYGGNEITDVLGKSKVEMTGGTLGVPRSHDSIQARPVNCNLFGAGMGDPRIIFNQWSNVGSTEVIVGGNAVIFGSVFGGGEDGHVLGDASTTIKGKAVIGTNGGSGLDGNVYGGGRGYSTWALTAGVVNGNVNLTIQDTATIHGSIYGGGRLAAVGTYLVPSSHANYGEMQSGTGHGNIAINITGGTIGNSHQMGGADHSVGDVFGGSKGILGLDIARDQKLGLAKNTTINISQATGRTTHILGNVYGGGEIASVGHYDYADADDTIAFMAAHKGETLYVGDVYDTIPGTAETIGLATIAISGGTIGTEAAIASNASQVAAYTHREAGHTLYRKGSVFGGCLGMAGTDYSGYSFVTNSKVTISGSALVVASVFGGGENGHVFNCTDVRIEGGQVGQEMEASEHEEDDNGVGKVDDIFFGNVYGGGRGIDTYRDHGVEYHSVTAGRVGDSANVTMTAGRVTHNIYGGGSLATVGYKDEQNSGTATVSITGGIVGYADGHTIFNDNGDYSYDGTDYANLSSANKELVKTFYKYAGNNEGNVYGSGRGHAGQNISDQYVQMAFTKNTDVTIGGNAQVRGSVFGGGENGHVRKDTKVTIAGTAQIGVPLRSAVDWGDFPQWHVSPDGYVSHDTLRINGSDTLLSEAYYQNESYGSGIHLHEHWIGDNGEGPTIYRGNVYGGGRGVTPTDPENNVSIDAHNYSATAGRVYGNATVEVTGGHIYHDLFGGGSLASVGTLVYSITTEGGVTKYKDPMGNEITGQFTFRQSTTSAENGWHDTATTVYTRPYYLGDAVTGTGLATVIVRGGVIGTRGINEGSVFGSGRGIAGAISSSVAHLANANNTYVSIRSGADIRGAVFGGGANGHVKEDTYVEMTGGTVGVMLPLAVRKIDERTGHGYRNYNGNVYGGGRGVSVVASTVGGSTQHLSETAGRVFGNTRVKISGGKVYHSVFGGGSLASVGDYSYKLWNDGDTHRYRHLFVQGTGQAVVHITGDAIIGNAAEALERPLNQYNANDALTAQYLLRTQIDNAEWHDLSAAAAQTKWNGLSDDQKQQMFTELNYHYLGSNSGMVFGSGRGVGALHNNTIDKDYANSAFTRNTIVVVDNDGDKIPVICGSVFGGGENGHVKINTHVDINGGIIGGIPLHDTAFYPGRAADNGIDGNGTFKFSNDANLKLSLEYEDDEDNAGHGPAVYRGNVYGGGRGVDHTDALRPEIGYSATAGRVYGDSEVEITGGVIYHHVFGGGSLASVGTYLFYEDGTPYRVDSLYEYKLVAYDAGHPLSAKRDPGKYAVRRAGFRTDGSEPDTMYVLAHADPGNVFVTVKGGQVGVTGINEGSVFGGGRGIAGESSDMVTLMAYCYRTDVTIDSVAMIRGSVFGGGANGHVLTDAAVTMTGGTVGATLSDAERAINSFGEADIKVYHGNVYGGGRGVDPISSGTGHNLSYTAGRVYGDASVNITGGTVLHNVYGGGSLATVGTILYRKNAGDPAPGTSLAPTTYDPHGTPQANTGSTSVTIGGTAIIGSDGMNNGSVFGSCRGVAGPGYSDRAYVYNTTVTIDAGTDGKPFIHGSVFGSGENGHVQNNTVVTINGGTIGSDITSAFTDIDAGSGTDAEKAEAKKKYDYIGNVYGAGRGVDTYKDDANKTHYSFSAGYVRNTTTVTVNGGTIYRNVYGGGSMGLVGDYGILGDSTTWQGSGDNGTATVNIYSTIGTAANRAKGYGGNVYGSSRGRANNPADAATISDFLADGGFGEFAYVYKSHVTVDAPGDTVYGSVYGGGENGHVDYGGTTVDILDGTIKGNIFGGGQGSPTSPTAGIVDGNTQVNIGASDYSNNGATIEGNVFGGNDAGSSPLGIMRVDVYKTAHTSANTCPTIVPPATEPDTTGSNIATNYAIFGVYGGGNQASVLTGNGSLDCSGTIYDTLYQDRITGTPSAWPVTPVRKSVVYVHGCENTIMYVYGGGRAANTLNNTVTIEGGRFFQVYAGGNGSSVEVPNNPGANVSALTGTIAPPNSGDATVTILGGLAGQLFGGSNSKGVVEGTATVDIAPNGNCPILTKEVFGGGNEAPGGSAVVTVPCGATGLTDVYGGARNADIGTPTDRKNIVLTIEGGDMTRVFGGNMSGGRIYGDVTVNVYGSNPGHTIDEVFGGSNEGGNIFGNIVVNIDSTHNSTCCGGCPLKLNNVYGGGNLVAYIPDSTWKDGTDHANPKDTVWSDPTRISPVVNVINGTVRQNVFGGGKGYQNLRPVLKPRTHAEWTSAGHSEYFTSQAAYDDSLATYNAYLDKVNAARVMGNPVVTIGAIDREVTTGVNPNARVGYVDGSGNVYPGNVYGGGNAAPVVGNTKVIIQGNRTDIMGSVYGGGNAAKVTGNTTVEIGDHN